MMCGKHVVIAFACLAFVCTSRIDARHREVQPVAVRVQIDTGWLEAREDAIWLVRDGSAERRLVRLGGRVVDIALSSDRHPLVAMALDGPGTRAVIVARFVPSTAKVAARLQILGGGVEPRRRPWRVTWGDVDGDGRAELLVGVIGKARFDPVERKRPFVYAWDGRRLVPKWLGSRLSRPIEDIILGNADDEGPDDLVAVESTRDGGLEVAVYAWKGFGFERRFSSSRITAPASLGCTRDRRILLDISGTSSRITVDGNRVLITSTESQ